MMYPQFMFFVFFAIYGLAFFSLGIIIFFYPKRGSRFKLAEDLGLIAFFGIFHGVNEWIDTLKIIHPAEPEYIKIARLVLLPASFFFLLLFATKTITGIKGENKPLKILPLVLTAVWVVLIFSSGRTFLAGDIFARYLLGIPGTFLAAYALVLHVPEIKDQDQSGTVRAIRVSAGVFIAYGLLAGLVVPDAGFFPASVFNYTVFFNKTGLPVQWLRTICALVLFFTITRMLKVFEWETMNSLKESRDLLEDRVKERTLELDHANQRLLSSLAEIQRSEQRITELNDNLKRHVAQLQSANRELEAFSYTVSHDLRAPLRHMAGFVELLNKRARNVLDEKSAHYLQVISGAAGQMGQLIDDLLAFSRAGRVELRWESVDSEAILREAINNLSSEISGRDIEWKIEELPHVFGDAALLRQVWVNLVSNAVKFTRPRKQAAIEIRAENKAQDFVFHIKDNGVGFDMKYKDKLFGLFQRLHRPEEFEGTGVGLANIQRIVHRHGGSVWAEGVPGEGAIFYFSLPKRK